MVSERYAKAYVEVLACLKLLKSEEYNRIPKDIINFFEINKDKNYVFDIDKDSIMKKKLSIEANSINLYLYMTYFSTKTINEKIEKRLRENENKYQLILKEKYNNMEDIFKKKNIINVKENTKLIEYRESFIEKIKNLLNNILKRKKQ